MPQIPKICSPVTALAFVKVNSRLLLLAGEGPLLRVYDQSTWRLLCSKRVFVTQAVHGITSPHVPAIFSEQADGQLLVWGGRSVCLLRINDEGGSTNSISLKVRDVIPEIKVEDWILEACFRPLAGNSEGATRSVVEAVLVTAHNVILHLHAQLDLSSNAAKCASISRMAAGPRSILYSAHVLWRSNAPGLVAAGTVYGEILYWSFSHGEDAPGSRQPIAGTLHRTFTGHEGSVFGVRISEETADLEFDIPTRILASCSDDRTIRIWDISMPMAQAVHNDSQKTLNLAHEGGSTSDTRNEISPSIATVMGHASRIWGVRFLCGANSNRYLLSLGEDTTAQVWKLHRKPITESCRSESIAANSMLLQQCTTLKLHSGKNIWASAVYQQSVNSNLVCTGGADGRIVCFNLHNPDVLPHGGIFSSQWTSKEVLEDLNNVHKTDIDPIVTKEAQAPLRDLFTALEARWKIIRNLDSAIPTYPSGLFEGTAVFEKRPPTSPAYDSEYLYIENGTLTTQQGLSLTANRRYVYRYHKDKATISAWFVKPDDGSTVDYLFHEMVFAAPNDVSLGQNENGKIRTLVATGRHPCIDDDYQAEYSFQIRGCSLHAWTLKYTVKGPKKDYIADAEYSHDSLASNLKTKSVADRIINEAPTSISAVQDSDVPGNLLPKADSFKAYTWVNEDVFLASTDLGWLYAGNLRISNRQNGLPAAGSSKSVFWERIAKIAGLKYSCIAASIPYHEAAIFAGASGTIHIYLHSDQSIHSPINVPGKIAYMNPHLLQSDAVTSFPKYPNSFEIGIIVCCLGSSVTHFFIVDLNKRKSKCLLLLDVVLDLSPNFIVTSSFYIPSRGILILGSRSGSLAIYDVSNRNYGKGIMMSSSKLEKIHGDDAITIVVKLPITLPKLEQIIFFLTAGRNGTYAIHRLDNKDGSANGDRKSIDFQTVHVCTTPIGRTIEGARFDPITKDLLLWGFRSKQFVVWNESQKMEIMTAECGGAHRNWAFLPLDGDGSGGSLVWTKASACNIHSQLHALHQTLQYGGHGREIKAMALSSPIRIFDGFTEREMGPARRYLATGAEDTTICIFSCTTDTKTSPGQQNRCSGIISKHTTGIQQLRWSSNGEILFSAAGCEEFFVWRVTPIPCLELGLVCEAHCPSTDASDLRIMDFDVSEVREGCEIIYLLSMVYSDSSVRIYQYSTQSGFKILSTGLYTTHCLTRAVHLRFTNMLSLCTASTDGHIAIWTLPTKFLQTDATTSTNAPLADLADEISHQRRIRIHQSSIKSLTALPLSPTTILLVTGGDDNALAFTLLTTLPPPPPPPSSSSSILEHSILLLPTAHASAITAIAYLDSSSHKPQSQYFFASSGNDQRLKIWRVGISDPDKVRRVDRIEITRLADVSTAVADVSCVGYHVGDEDKGGDEGDEGMEGILGTGGVLVVAGIGVERFDVGRDFQIVS